MKEIEDKHSTMVRQILSGSKRIDEMKKETKNLCSILMGAFKSFHKNTDHSNDFFELRLATYWKFSVGTFSGKIHVIFTYFASGNNIALYSSTDREFNLKPEDVIKIHASLPELLREFIAEFPWIAETLAPLIVASNI